MQRASRALDSRRKHCHCRISEKTMVLSVTMRKMRKRTMRRRMMRWTANQVRKALMKSRIDLYGAHCEVPKILLRKQE